MTKNLLLTIAYDGSCFHGWQKQPGQRTVQGYLEETFSRLFKTEVLLSGTSRTDAGVHALGQRATLKTDIAVPTERMAMVLNNALCSREKNSFNIAPVRILEVREMPEEFHARFDAKGKEYVYRIRDGGPGEGAVFERNYIYHVKEKLDVEAMDRAASYLVGKKDFKSFEASGDNPRQTTVREIYSAHVERTEDGIIEFRVKGDGFLYNMVRIMTGTLVEAGRGALEPERIIDITAACDRTRAGHTAPPFGLYLAEVFY